MPVETMADDIDDVDALLEEPYQKVSPVCLSSATSAQVALPLLIGAELKTLKSSSKPL